MSGKKLNGNSIKTQQNVILAFIWASETVVKASKNLNRKYLYCCWDRKCHSYVMYGCNKTKKGHIHSWGNKQKSQIQARTRFREASTLKQTAQCDFNTFPLSPTNTMAPGRGKGIIPIPSTGRENLKVSMDAALLQLVRASGYAEPLQNFPQPGYKSGLRSTRLTSSALNSCRPAKQWNAHLSQK